MHSKRDSTAATAKPSDQHSARLVESDGTVAAESKQPNSANHQGAQLLIHHDYHVLYAVTVVLDEPRQDICAATGDDINTDPTYNDGYDRLNSGDESEDENLSELDVSDTDYSVSESIDEDDEELFSKEEHVTAYLETPYHPVSDANEYPDLWQGRHGPRDEALKRGGSTIFLFFLFIPVAMWQYIAECSNFYMHEQLDNHVNAYFQRKEERERKGKATGRSTPTRKVKTHRDVRQDFLSVKPITARELCVDVALLIARTIIGNFVSFSQESLSDSDSLAGFVPEKFVEAVDEQEGCQVSGRPNCSAIQRLLYAGESDSDSEVHGEAAAVSSSSGHGRQASSGSTTVSSTSAPPPSSQVTLASLTRASQDSIVDLASADTPVSSSALAEDLDGADSSGYESSSTTKQTEVASTLASLSGATKSVVIRTLPPGKHPAWRPGDSDSDGGDSTGGGSAATPPNLSNKLVEPSDSSVDESTLAGPSKPKAQAVPAVESGSPPLASPTVAVRPPQVTTSAPVSATVKAPVSPKTPPPSRSLVRPATSTSKSSSASKAKAVVPARSAKDASKSTLQAMPLVYRRQHNPAHAGTYRKSMHLLWT
ncbi:unnamed protein product [Phytophthora fragariaefolia]|uniref:Unnamed protein product n=1 Tax=Phytophthora fragariaefolia TaxID=1490495 RepID=A0A9W6UFG6_9STRA|nr:unnamed protein product [Phytophthora fragariaefolia]